MNTELRYVIACARLSALSDTDKWTEQDMADVFLLSGKPPMSIDAFRNAVGLADGVTEPAPNVVPCADAFVARAEDMATRKPFITVTEETPNG